MYHPMTGKKTKLKVHWYKMHQQTPWGTNVSVACRDGYDSSHLVYSHNINDITCLKCMDIATRPEKSNKDAMSHSFEEVGW